MRLPHQSPDTLQLVQLFLLIQLSVTATASDGSGMTATCSVTVTAKEPDPVLVTSLTLDYTSRNVVEGDEFVLTATVLPSDATNTKLEWSSSDESVAVVDNEGKVRVLAAGSCVITVRTTDGSALSATCELHSETNAVDDITVDGFSGKVDIYTLTGILVVRHGDIDDFRALAPGYYIVNGRKLLKR